VNVCKNVEIWKQRKYGGKQGSSLRYAAQIQGSEWNGKMNQWFNQEGIPRCERDLQGNAMGYLGITGTRLKCTMTYGTLSNCATGVCLHEETPVESCFRECQMSLFSRRTYRKNIMCQISWDNTM